MHIYIDGYNLLHWAFPEDSGSKKCFLQALNRYARLKMHEVHVVFDGGDGAWPMKECEGVLHICHVGSGSSADEYLTMLSEKEKNKNILFVTSDTTLAKGIIRNGFSVIDADLFWEFVKKALQLYTHKKVDFKEQIVKKGSGSWTQFDQLMKESTSTQASTKELIPEESIQSRVKMGSRLDKRIIEIIKKL